MENGKKGRAKPMRPANYDVVVVGAGAAGLTAAVALARKDFSVLVLEGAPFPGAENWSGCVYFSENLAHPDVLGPEGLEQLAWERRLVERGVFLTNGHGLAGITYRDPEAFRHCYTVLRPVFDRHLSEVARRLGVAILTDTTADGLIREGGRVIGVSTQRGPVYAPLVFLAEGDASHLVSKEGYERRARAPEHPHFLQGVKQVIELPAEVIEARFGLAPDEGAAYEYLLRNGSLNGRPVTLNMGGFLYTNRNSISLGFVLPVSKLADGFEGNPHLLMEWIKGLPEIQRLIEGGKPGPFGAKLIRGGGEREIPYLVDHGLAIGGAASGIGVDFPYPNFTGPATAMGLLIARAAERIRATGGTYSLDELQTHYVQPLRRTHYAADVRYLRGWPSYVERTQFFFGRNLDVALATLYTWSRPRQSLWWKWWQWVRLLRTTVPFGKLGDFRRDTRRLARTLDLPALARGVVGWQTLLRGALNTLRDLTRTTRPQMGPSGNLSYVYRVEDGSESSPSSDALPNVVVRWGERLRPVLARAARQVYRNEAIPLRKKLRGALETVFEQCNFLDLLAVAGVLFTAAVSIPLQALADRIRFLIRRPTVEEFLASFPRRYVEATKKYTALETGVASAATTPNGDSGPPLPADSLAQDWEEKLSHLSYFSDKRTHILLNWPDWLEERGKVRKDALCHVCPAHVFECHTDVTGAVRLVANFENCIKCETCWRGSQLVDWGRDGRHRLLYPLKGIGGVAGSDRSNGPGDGLSGPRGALPPPPCPALPHLVDYWQPHLERLRHQLLADGLASTAGTETTDVQIALCLVKQIDRKAEELRGAVTEEPRTVDHPRARWIETLAGYLRPLAEELRERVSEDGFFTSGGTAVEVVRQSLLAQIENLFVRIDDVLRHTWDRRLFWAASDAQQMRGHHLVGIRRTLELLAPNQHAESSADLEDTLAPHLVAEQFGETRRALGDAIGRRLDRVFSSSQLRAIDRGQPFSAPQSRILAELLEDVVAAERVDPTKGNGQAQDNGSARSAESTRFHPLERKVLLEELAKRDPSLAFAMSQRLLAYDALHLAGADPDSFLAPGATPVLAWEGPLEWLADDEGTALAGEKTFVPTAGADWFVLLVGNRLVSVHHRTPGLRVERLETLGLRGAELARLVFDAVPAPPTTCVVADVDRFRDRLTKLTCADLLAISLGMAETLSARAVEHALGRVQFPGLFHDESARDGVGKFGAVKKMVAEIEARRLVLETLAYDPRAGALDTLADRWALRAKAVAAESLGTSPGSITYNAGQVFGGTGFSEDDILTKFYRDASTWRHLAPANIEVIAELAEQFAATPEGLDAEELAGVTPLLPTLRRRKALQPEVDTLRRAQQDLRAALAARKQGTPLDETRCFLEIGAAWQVLARVHARLEAGLDAELPLELLYVLTSDSAQKAQSLRRLAEQPTPAVEGPDSNDEPDAVLKNRPSPLSYDDFLGLPTSYNFGDFLLRPLDVTEPAYSPEMVARDERLREYDTRLYELLHAQFGSRTFDGLPYDRYLEKQHRMSPDDLAFLTHHGFFRMPIPKQLGGEGRMKADYSLLIKHSLLQGDVSLALTIQANTSIGTTPALLALKQDLPRAKEELELWLEGPQREATYRDRISELTSLLDQPDPRRLEKPFRALADDVQNDLAKSAVLRSVFARFLQQFQSAALAGERRDLEAFPRHLRACAAVFDSDAEGAGPLLEELGLRRRACEQFLNWISAGQISAFALTEPSAGSDTARIATRAVLKSAEVHVRSDGMLSFCPDGADEDRVLLDAARLQFASPEPGATPKAVYRWSDDEPPSEIQFDEYDYEIDDPLAQRYYDHAGRKVYFTDIAHVRRRDGRLYYDYWQLDGAKMWITNGRLAGVMVLYAKTSAGVTALLVDRHAEGLVVGKDEEKMGQCGSPTNELSLTAVRVPFENVAGLEGRGQVNALETLNVGRAGLAVSAVSLMDQLIDEAAEFASRRWQRPPDWVGESLDAMRDEQFACESLSYELVGRFDHPGTKSVRMESAIAKMFVSEALHYMIEQAEDLYGLLGQTRAYRIEKHKRDARILNIYEGTNEVQRFFILKDLVNEVAPRSKDSTTSSGSDGAIEGVFGEYIEHFETCRSALLERLEQTVSRFGRDGWLNPNLQPTLFNLSESAAWLLVLASSLRRCHMLFAGESESKERARILSRAARLTDRFREEIDAALGRFDEEFDALCHGFYPPSIRAAELAFQRDQGESRPEELSASPIRDRPDRRLVNEAKQSGRWNVLVLVEPRPELSPEPVLRDGRFDEVYYRLDAKDAAALGAALKIAKNENVHVTVAAVGTRRSLAVLREALALGADEAVLVVAPYEPIDPAAACEALAITLLRMQSPIDLLLTRTASSEGEAGRLGVLLAARLGIPWHAARQGVDLRTSAEGSEAVMWSGDAGDAADRNRVVESATLPIACALEAPTEQTPPFTTTGWLDSVQRPLGCYPWPAEVRLPDSRLHRAGHSTTDVAEQDEATRLRSPDEAACYFAELSGLRPAGGLVSSENSNGNSRSSSVPRLGTETDWQVRESDFDLSSPLSELDDPYTLAIVVADRNGKLAPSEQSALTAASYLARQWEVTPTTLVLYPGGPKAEMSLMKTLSAQGIQLAWLWRHRHLSPDLPELCRRVLESGWQTGARLRAVVASSWASESLAVLAEGGFDSNHEKVPAIVFGATRFDLQGARLAVEVPQGKSRLVRSVRHTLDEQSPLWLCVADSCEVPKDSLPSTPLSAVLWTSDVPLEDWFSRSTVAGALRAARRRGEQRTGLAGAEVIVDVGAGIRNRDGMEEVIEPLVKALKRLGVGSVEVGGSRKVTEELGLLPADRQIGQTGQSVNPKLLLAIGISGAPQHLGYIGPRATIFSFNRDPEAPMMTLNQRTPRPCVVPIVGDLFETVPAFTEALTQLGPQGESGDFEGESPTATVVGRKEVGTQ